MPADPLPMQPDMRAAADALPSQPAKRKRDANDEAGSPEGYRRFLDWAPRARSRADGVVARLPIKGEEYVESDDIYEPLWAPPPPSRSVFEDGDALIALREAAAGAAATTDGAEVTVVMLSALFRSDFDSSSALKLLHSHAQRQLAVQWARAGAGRS